MGYTVKDLKTILAQYSEETLVLVEGYEDGFSDIGNIKKSQVQLDKNNKDWEGPHAEVDIGGRPAILIIRAPNPNAL